MPNILHILLWGIVVGVASYAVGSFIAWERGPLAVFERIRGLPAAGSELDYFLSCFFCQSPWLAAVLSLVFWLTGAMALGAVTAYLSAYTVALGVAAYMGRRSVSR